MRIAEKPLWVRYFSTFQFKFNFMFEFNYSYYNACVRKILANITLLPMKSANKFLFTKNNERNNGSLKLFLDNRISN